MTVLVRRNHSYCEIHLPITGLRVILCMGAYKIVQHIYKLHQLKDKTVRAAVPSALAPTSSFDD